MVKFSKISHQYLFCNIQVQMSIFDCCLMLLSWLVWAHILWEINISASRSEHRYLCWIGTVAFYAPGAHWADWYIPDDQWVGRGWGNVVKRLAWFKICFDDCWYLDSNVHGANMGPTWGQQDPGGPQVGPVNFAIWVSMKFIWILWGSSALMSSIGAVQVILKWNSLI